MQCVARVKSEIAMVDQAFRYAFIQPDAGGPDVFVHISAVERAGSKTSVSRRFSSPMTSASSNM